MAHQGSDFRLPSAHPSRWSRNRRTSAISVLAASSHEMSDTAAGKLRRVREWASSPLDPVTSRCPPARRCRRFHRARGLRRPGHGEVGGAFDRGPPDGYGDIPIGVRAKPGPRLFVEAHASHARRRQWCGIRSGGRRAPVPSRNGRGPRRRPPPAASGPRGQGSPHRHGPPPGARTSVESRCP